MSEMMTFLVNKSDFHRRVSVTKTCKDDNKTDAYMASEIFFGTVNARQHIATLVKYGVLSYVSTQVA